MKKFEVVKDRTKQILVISGASGSGKTTTCALLGFLYPNNYVHIPFDRSRASRPGEFGSRQVNVDVMFQKYQSGEYFNIAPVTHNGYAAIRTADINQAFADGKVAVIEFPLEKVDVLEKNFPQASVTVVELVAPSEKERLRRLKKDHKYTDQRIEGDAYGSGRIERYKDDNLLTLDDHNLVLITERDRLGDTVYSIHRYMQIQQLTLEQLTSFERSEGIRGVQSFLKSLRVPKNEFSKSENYEFLEHKLPHTEDYER